MDMLNDRENNAKKKWSRMQEQGKNKFIFRTGFLLYGMTLFFIYILTIVVINMVYHPEIKLIDFLCSEQFLKRLLSTFILFGLMGWFMGNSIWRSYKRRWEELKMMDNE
ncbi:MAG: hypothetical protein V1779_05950 [bacterium]